MEVSFILRIYDKDYSNDQHICKMILKAEPKDNDAGYDWIYFCNITKLIKEDYVKISNFSKKKN